MDYYTRKRAGTARNLWRNALLAGLATPLTIPILGPVPVAQAATGIRLTHSIPAASIQRKCSNVKIWLIGIDPDPQGPSRFYLLFTKTAGGWIANLGLKPQTPGIMGTEPVDQIGTAQVVVRGASLYVHDVNTSGTQPYGKSVTYHGNLAPDCTIGETYYEPGSSVVHRMTPFGTWSGGTFTATPQDTQPATVGEVSPNTGPSTGGSSVDISGWGFGTPGSSIRVDLCPIGVAANSMTVIDSKCAQATTFSVRSEFLVTAAVPPAPAAVLSNCNPQGLCKAQLSVGVGAFEEENGLQLSHLASNAVTFTYRRSS